jgi:hypothetical protein
VHGVYTAAAAAAADGDSSFVVGKSAATATTMGRGRSLAWRHFIGEKEKGRGNEATPPRWSLQARPKQLLLLLDVARAMVYVLHAGVRGG